MEEMILGDGSAVARNHIDYKNKKEKLTSHRNRLTIFEGAGLTVGRAAVGGIEPSLHARLVPVSLVFKDIDHCRRRIGIRLCPQVSPRVLRFG